MGRHGTGHDRSELDSTEVAQLQALINGKHDRPAVWAQNILCFHYGLCRPPYTGGGNLAPKALPYTPKEVVETPRPTLMLYPNPATIYVTMYYDLKADADHSRMLIRDIGGREVAQRRLGHAEGQVVLDTRRMPPGVYTIELHNAGQRQLTEKLVVRP
ncbi:MAG: T9SS type A sorting domain-containing protein [Flavobacteriales bacterium]|nr:T9SS type A sorting domain-containing protein [Flavobacteriales bacterium]